MASNSVEPNDCIGNLEHHIHRVFASVRVAGEDFVYCSSSELYSRLDDYCDESSMHDMKQPLLIKGESGTGKTALLANWLYRREQTGSRMRSNVDEFVFWHAVGCSRQSLNVNSMLRRLITDLKTKFELERQIPKSQERLSWELPRFLELASRKGRVIVVIDGLHRLRLNDGSEDSLAWLPLKFPPNVRVVLSVTTNTSKPSMSANDKNIETFTPFLGGLSNSIEEEEMKNHGVEKTSVSKKSRILSELERRDLPSIVMKALDGSTCRSLVTAYIEKSINQESSKIAAGPCITSLLNEKNNLPDKNSDFIAGFLMFESQLDILLRHSLGGNPLFLRLFLRCLHFLCSRGYSLWSVFENWISASSVQDLMSRILMTCEAGYKKTRHQAQRDCDLSLDAGGLTAMRMLYSWHPAFKGEDLRSASDVLPLTPFDKPIESPEKKEVSISENMSTTSKGTRFEKEHFGRDVEDMGKKETAVLSSQVLQNLGDQDWISVEKVVQKQLHRALIDSRRAVEDAILSETAGKDRGQFLSEVITRIRQNQSSSVESAESSVVSHAHPNVLHRTKTALFESGSVSLATAMQSKPDDASDSDEEESWDDGSVQSFSTNKNRPGFNHAESYSSSPFKSSRQYLEPPTPSSTKQPTQSMQHALVHAESTQFFNTLETQDTSSRMVAQHDPAEGFHSIPSYLRGGESVVGFGDLLGNALSLLYVARQGLKEEELWNILSKLQLQKRSQQKMFQEKRELQASQETLMRKIVRNALKDQGFLENAFMAEDINCLGYISLQKMYTSMKKCYDDLKPLELRHLVDFIIKRIFSGAVDETAHLVSFPGLPFIENDSVHYTQFFIILKKLNRQFHLHDSKGVKTTARKASVSEAYQEEDFEDFTLPPQVTAQVEGESGGETDGDVDQVGEGGSNDAVLGPVIEQSLLEILCSLGVLYSPENKVLILPSDSEPFRQTIYNRYILPRGGGSVHYWHSLIIQYFRRQANSMRKCEELPWHLKICRKWTSLKKCLVDLKTFDLMFNNDLKDELMDYWRLLTEGPLYVVDTANILANTLGNVSSSQIVSSGKGALTGRTSFMYALVNKQANKNEDDDEDNLSTLSNVLKEIDEAQASSISIKDVRRKLMRFQIQPFDAVEELNRSLEAWIIAERPPPQWIHRTIMQISRFLLEFSKFTHSCPQFRRLGIDMTVLERFSLLFDEVKDAMVNGAPSFTNAEVPEDQAILSAGEGKTLTESANRGNFLSQKSMKDKYFDGVQKQDVVRFPTPKMASGNLYLYLRWIWIQFPWLALHPAATVAIKNAQANGDQLNIADSLENSEESGADPSFDESTKHLLRVWNVKKSDPTIPVFSSSLNRKLAAIKPRTSLSNNLERNVDVSCKKLYQELTAPSHIAQVRLGIGMPQRDKFRRTFQQEIELSKNIPFAYHGVKTMKSGSLFPSYNASVKELNRKRVEADLLLDDDSSVNQKDTKFNRKKPLGRFNLDQALKNSLAGSANSLSTFFLTELDDEIRRMTHDEYLQNHRAETVATNLIKDETDLELVTILDRISRMKSICNKLLIIQREKERSIEELENEIILRQDSDTHLINEVQNGEALIKTLHERNVTMERSLKEAKILQDGYLELIKALKTNPPYNEAHVQALEVEVDLAKKQFEDLCNHRHRLYVEGEKLDHVRKQQLTERINYFQVARQEIAAKKKQVWKEIRYLKATLGDKNKKDRHGRGHKVHDRSRKREDKDGMHSDRSYSSDDSETSKESLKDLTLTQPVIHFINALVRKVTYNENIIKETDKSLDDVKKRAAASSIVIATENSQANDPSPAPVPVQNAPSTLSTAAALSMRRRTRMTEIHHGKKTGRLVESDSDSVTTSLQSQAGGVTFRNVNQGQVMFAVPGVGPAPPKKKLTMEEIAQLKESIKSMVSATKDSNKDNFKAQLQKALALMLQKTESNSFDEFLERFVQGQSLLETLRSQQVLVDSRLAQLRAEHAELYAIWSDISFLSEERASGSTNIPPSTAVNVLLNAPSPGKETDETSDRYLDNQLFAKEVRLHHYQRLYDKSVHVISEVRTAISHVMGLLKINSKLLAALPRTSAPDLNSDQDMVACLSWCEDRIIALNEALTMDANRPNAANNEEKSKPLSQRQSDLAEEIHRMMYEKKSRKASYKGQKKQQGAISKVLIISSDSKGYVSSPRGVVVPPSSKVDKIYDAKVAKIRNERDRQQDLTETQTFYSRDTTAQNEVQRFLAEGLDLKLTKDMSRQAKLLLNKHQGRQQAFGLVLEELMKSRGQTISLGSTSANNIKGIKQKTGHQEGGKVASMASTGNSPAVQGGGANAQSLNLAGKAGDATGVLGK